MVGALDHVEIVLDDQNGVARVHQLLQHVDELAHVIHMKARGRLVEDIKGGARGLARKLGRKLHALGLAARERG